MSETLLWDEVRTGGKRMGDIFCFYVIILCEAGTTGEGKEN
jgi:hypothetical protein